MKGTIRGRTLTIADYSQIEFRIAAKISGDETRLGAAFTERLNGPVQGNGADGLKLTLTLLHERRDEFPGAVPILTVHDEIVVECDEGDAKEVEAWLKRAMVDGMDGVLNAPDVEGPRVPVEVETEVGKAWGA